MSKFSNDDIRGSLHVFVIALGLVLVVQWLIKYLRVLKTLPPGPWGLPIIGFLPFIGQEKHISFMGLAKKYGSVFCTQMGNQLTVVISDYKLIRESFVKQEFSNRPDTPFMHTLEGYGMCA